MKVLIATTYIYREEWSEFTRNRTGFGFMVNDILESVSKKADVYLLSQVITKGHENILTHTWLDVFVSARLSDWTKGFKQFFSYKQGVKGRVKYFYYALNSGTIRKTIQTIKPDIVHIQGIGMQIKPFIEVCEEENVPYIVTLHGLIGLDKTVKAAQWDKKMERDFLVEAEKKRIPVTVISSGMKRRIEEQYLGHKAENIAVVYNGTKISNTKMVWNPKDVDLRIEYGLESEKIVTVIGSLCERKNQIQVVRAMATGIVNTPCHVFFCGTDTTNGEMQKIIDEVGLKSRIHLLGFLPREKIDMILNQADLNVVASKDEGFGLSIIEAFCHGIPTVTFADLDAVPDMYDERCMVKVDSREDIALAEGIEKGLNKIWDKAWIMNYAKNYSVEKMAERYEAEYKKTISRRKSS